MNITEANGPPSGSFTNTWGQDANYTVRLIASGDTGVPIQFETTLDETLSLGIASQWAAPFENLISEAAEKLSDKSAIVGRAVGMGGVLADATGMRVRPKQLTAQVWQSSDPIRLTIPFTFVAINDANKDVRQKVIDMLKLVAPTEKGPMVIAPGPVMVDLGQGGSPIGRKIELHIGRFMRLDSCVVENVQVQFENTIGHQGIPLRAKVNVDIRSWYSFFTVQDIDSLFSPSGG